MLVQIRVNKILYSRANQQLAYLNFEEVEGSRQFSVSIGKTEADSIFIFLSFGKHLRPFTHDLMKNIMEVLGGKLKQIVIAKVENHIFYTDLHIEYGKDTLVVPSRLSDAVALSVRCGCAMFIQESALQNLVEAAIQDVPNLSSPAEHENHYTDLANYTDIALEELLNDVLKNENYELAIRIRDELNKRKNDRNQNITKQ